MAIDGSRSSFKPSDNTYTLDTFEEKFELTQSNVKDVQEWKNLKAKGQTETQTYKDLTALLSDKIVTAEDWNLLLDAMFNLERAYVDKGLDQIGSTVENYISTYVEQNSKDAISEKINTTIESSYSIGAVKIIISNTQPATVTNGALWIKPKTT